MGWSTWYGFGCNYTEATIRAQAARLTSSGLIHMGYSTLILDDCITPKGARDGDGNPIPDSTRFPSGVPKLISDMHALGFKVGVSTDVGDTTCQGYEGSLGYEDVDASAFASWGVDYVVAKACSKPVDIPLRALFTRLGSSLNFSGRPMAYAIDAQGQENVQQWGSSVAHVWRTGGDIVAQPGGAATWPAMVGNYLVNAQYPNVTAPEAWQDPDALVVGLAGMGTTQWRTHFSLWAITSAPLMIAADLTTATPEALMIFLCGRAVSINQDPLGHAATPLGGALPPPTGASVWVKRMSGGRCAILFANLGGSSSGRLAVTPRQCGAAPASAYSAVDVWTGVSRTLGPDDPLAADLEAYSSEFLTVIGLA